MKIKEKCAVFGAYTNNSLASYYTYLGLSALQHRGQESSGISVLKDKHIITYKNPGLVSEVFNSNILHRLKGKFGIGHNRYSTSGGTSINHIQPIHSNASNITLAHNGNIASLNKLKTFFRKNKISYEKLNDSGMICEAISFLVGKGLKTTDAIKEVFDLLTGSFSLLVLDHKGITAVRDRFGIRPLVMGELNGNYFFASETCALDAVEAKFLKEVYPGEMIRIDEEGIHSEQIVEPIQKLDIFEFIYFARNDSMLLGQSIYEVRKNLGKNLALENKINGDIVVPVPESAIPASIGFSQESGIPIEYGLQRNRYIQRTFIMPSQENREKMVKQKLNVINEVIRGKRIILIDDSIVRGTTSKKIVSIIRESGAKEIHMLVSSAPIIYPDFYGIDLPDRSELIAANKTIKEIADYIGVDSLNYLSIDSMIKSTGLAKSLFCTSCFTGEYPIDVSEVFDPELEKLQA